jgi:hypothetical protein
LHITYATNVAVGAGAVLLWNRRCPYRSANGLYLL